MDNWPLLASVTVLLTPRSRNRLKFVTVAPLIVKRLPGVVASVPMKNWLALPFQVVVPVTPRLLLVPLIPRFPLAIVALAKFIVLLTPPRATPPPGNSSCPPLVTSKLFPVPLTVTPLPNPVTVPPSTVIATPPFKPIAEEAMVAAKVPFDRIMMKSLAPAACRPCTTARPLVTIRPLVLPPIVTELTLL